MRHYCTLFDRNYLSKGLAMYDSLKRHSSEPFRLHLLPLDKETADTVDYQREALFKTDRSEDIELYSSDFFKNQKGMPHAEWCWSLASQFCEELIMRFGLPEVTYLDADLFFFASPEPIFKEIGYKSIGIFEHRFIPSKQHLQATSGRFNVGLVHFKNTSVGRACLSRWAAQVRERCDSETCGDQKRLDEWPSLYGDECCIVRNIGGGLGPWNLANHRVSPGPCVDGERAIVYHFHEYSHGVRLTNYELRPEDIQLIYEPYVRAIDEATARIESIKATC